MKNDNQTNFRNLNYKNVLPTLTLGGLLLLSSFAAMAFEKQNNLKFVTDGQQLSDTTKVVKGVPLKPEDVSPLLVGESIPIAKMLDAKGEEFDLNKAVSEKPTILVFYRGGWCPFCSKELSGLQEIQSDLSTMGYQVIAVSTDSPKNLSKSMTKEKLTYTLLSDGDLEVSKKFGIAFKSPANYDSFLPEASGFKNVDKLLPVPSVFILNTTGEIIFEYINPNFKQRISSALLKAAAQALISKN